MAQLKQVCTVTNGSQTITVIGVNVAYRIRANNMFMVVNELVPYTVATDAVFDGVNTVVQLTGAYQGASNAMAPSSFVTDFTAPDNLPLISQGDVGTAAVWTAAMYRLQEMIGSVTPAGLTAFIAEINATQAAAAASQLAAKTSETNSKASETKSAASQSAASNSAAAALASQNAAKTSETNSKTSETNASNSAGQARTSATQSGSSADAAAASASAAFASQLDASGSAASALTSKNAAKTSETNSAVSAAAAKTSETNAGASETNAGASKTAAAGSAAAALASQNAAKSSETNSKTSETNAAASASSAAADRATVQGIVKSMNELYLGEQAADPTKDNNGGALKVGAEYFNNVRNIMRVYTSKGWQDVDIDAQTQAANATASASAAAGSAAGALSSAGAAAASQAAALASQNAAKTSETNSKTSETNSAATAAASLASQKAAAASETNSKTSETNAAASAAHADDVAARIGNPVAKGGDTMTGDLYMDGAKVVSTRYGTGGALVLRAASGTQAAQTALTTGSQAGTLTYRGYDGANFQDMASIDAWADGAVSSTSSAAYLSFATTQSGATGKAERMRLTSAGRLLLGSVSDDGTSLLQVNGNARFKGGVQSSGLDAAGQFRAVAGSYGVLLRNDGSNVYLMQTASGDQYGTFNSFRPFQWSLTTGAVTIDAPGASTTFGGAVIVNNASSLALRGNAGLQRQISFQSGAVDRWRVITDSSAEGGANVGSDFYIQAMSDAGAYLSNALKITRSTGRVWLGSGLDVQGTLTTSGTATITGALTAQAGFNNTNGTIYNYGWGGSTGKAVYTFSADGSKYLLYDGSSYTLAGGGLSVAGPLNATGAVTSTSGQMVISGWSNNPASGVLYFGAAANNKYLYYDGTNFQFSGGDLNANGNRVWHGGNLPSPMQTTGGTFSGQVDYNTTLRMLNANAIQLWAPGNGSFGVLRGDVGYCGFLNQAQSAWNLTISDGGAVNFPRARPTWAGLVPWDNGNFNPGSYQPAGSYIRQYVYNDGSGFGLTSGAAPSIAYITSQSACLTLQNQGNNSASCVINFRREGSFAAYFGLDTDNQWAVGGGSHGTIRYRLWHEGNLSPATAGATVRRTGTFELADIDGHGSRGFQDAPDNAVVIGMAVVGWYGPNGDCVGAVRLRVSRLVNQ